MEPVDEPSNKRQPDEVELDNEPPRKRLAKLDEENMTAIKQTHCIALASSLATMRDKEKTDVTLICRGKEFFAHRFILEAASPYFMKMFSCNLQESISRTIMFDFIETETLEAILDFIYTGKTEHINTEELLKSVLITSHLIQLEDLVQYCDQALIRLMSLDNFFDLLDIGLKYKLEDWRQALLSFWVINSSKLVDREEFLVLKIEEIKELVNFVKCKSQCLDVMMMGFLNWLRYDLKSREKFVDEFFDCVEAKLVKQQFINSWLKDNTIMTLSEIFAERVRKCSMAVMLSGSEPPEESVILDVCSWDTKLTYFSKFRYIDVFDPAKKNCTVQRLQPFVSSLVQQFDLSNMTWLPLQIPEVDIISDFKHMYQFGEIIYMINETHMGLYDIQSNEFRKEELKHILPLGSELAVFKGHVYTHYYKHMFYSNLGSCECKNASTLPFSINSSTLLTSTEYLYVIGVNPERNEEFIIQFNSNPSNEVSNWEIITIIKGQLQSTDFFIYNNTLNGFLGFEEIATSTTFTSPFSGSPKTSKQSKDIRLRELTYNHSTKRMVVSMHKMPEHIPHLSLKLSRFQDCRCPYVFFARCNDNFSIPFYAWQPDNGVWTELSLRRGKCCIPNEPSVKLVYNVDK